MTGRPVDVFDFNGRLSRSGSRRLAVQLTAFWIAGWLAPLFLLLGGAPRAVAWLPLCVFPFLLVAEAAAGVRRLHDVGRDARSEGLKSLGVFAMILGPLGAVLALPGLPEPLLWTLLGTSAAILAAAAFRGRPERGPGDPGPNRFGPPPE